jgi:hypothetical protein
LTYLPPGPGLCKLGDTRAQLLRKKAGRPVFQQGCLVLTPPDDSPYDQYQVRFDGDNRAVQITARHRLRWKEEPGPAQLAKAVETAWAKKFRSYGWPRREDSNERKQMKSWTTHDEATRLCVFWEEGRSGVVRLYTEWTAVAAHEK